MNKEEQEKIWEEDRIANKAKGFCLGRGIRGSWTFQIAVYKRDWESVEWLAPNQRDCWGASSLDTITRDYIREESARDGHPIAI